MSAANLAQLVTSAGGGGVLVYLVIGFVRGWIVPGYIYRRAVRERSDLLTAVLQSTAAAKLVIETTKRREQDQRVDE